MAITITASNQLGTVLKVDGGPASFDLFSLNLVTGVVTTTYLGSMRNDLESKVGYLFNAIGQADRAARAEGILRSLLRVGSFEMQELTFTVAAVGDVATASVTGYADPGYVLVTLTHSIEFPYALDAGFQATGGGGGAASSGVMTTAELTLRADTIGVDGPIAARPLPITGGAYTSDAEAFATVNGALVDVPPILKHDVTVILGAEAGDLGGSLFAIDGAQLVAGFQGSGTLRLQGQYLGWTPATGAASGVADVGTTATSVVKPAAAANWTANDLVGHFVLVVIGGERFVRAVKSNTTTTIAVDAVPGLAAGQQFYIVDPGVEVRATDAATPLTVTENNCPIEVSGLRFAQSAPADILQHLIDVSSSKRVTIDGCLFDVDATLYVLGAALNAGTEQQNLTITNCIFTDSCDVLADGLDSVTVEGVRMDGAGAVIVQNSHTVTVRTLESTNAPSSVLRVINADVLSAEVSAVDGGATPVYLENIQAMEAAGTRLVGAGNLGYGVEIQKAGLYTLTGSTITGATGDVNFMDNAVTWANLSSASFGIAEEHAGSAVANSAYTKALKYGSYLFQGNVDVSGRLLLYGYLNTAFPLTAQTATGSGAGDALDMDAVPALGGIEISTTPPGTGVKLPSNAAVPGVVVWVVNRGANTLTVYPPTGGTIDTLASVTISSGRVKGFVSLQGNSGRDYWTISAT